MPAASKEHLRNRASQIAARWRPRAQAWHLGTKFKTWTPLWAYMKAMGHGTSSQQTARAFLTAPASAVYADDTARFEQDRAYSDPRCTRWTKESMHEQRHYSRHPRSAKQPTCGSFGSPSWLLCCTCSGQSPGLRCPASPHRWRKEALRL